MKYLALFSLICGVVLISGCVSLFGPESVINSFYNALDNGNYESAAAKTTIPIDKTILGDDLQTKAFVTLVQTLFGKNGENIKLGALEVESKTELDPQDYQSRYKGNVTEAYEITVKVPLMVQVGTDTVSWEANAYRHLTHDVFKVDGFYYVKVDLSDLKDFVLG